MVLMFEKLTGQGQGAMLHSAHPGIRPKGLPCDQATHR